MHERSLFAVALISLATASVSCGKPFRIPDRIRPIAGNLTGRTLDQGLALEATAVTDEDELIQRFNGNLVLARILVVNLTLKNQTDRPVAFRRLMATVSNARGEIFESLSPHEAVDQLYRYYKIKNYFIISRERLEADFQQRGLRIEGDVGRGEVRQGLLFFKFPPDLDEYDPLTEVTLHLKRLRFFPSNQDTSIEVQLRRRAG